MAFTLQDLAPAALWKEPRRQSRLHPHVRDMASRAAARGENFLVPECTREATVDFAADGTVDYARGYALEHGRLLLDDVPLAASQDPYTAATRYTFYSTAMPENIVHAQRQVNELQALAAADIVQRDLVREVQRRLEDQMAAMLYTYGTGTLYTENNTVGIPIQTSWTSTNIANYFYAGTADIYRAELNWNWGKPALETPEQTAARAARDAKLVVVRARADRLFMAHLSHEQLRTWTEHRHLDMMSPSGRRYRIKKFWSANVFLLDAQGREVRKYCAYANDPGGMLPEGDHWYLQMLALQYDERAFLRAANTWDLLRNGVFVGQGVDADAPDVPLVLAA